LTGPEIKEGRSAKKGAHAVALSLVRARREDWSLDPFMLQWAKNGIIND
jgi:hypothetical protein